MRRFIRFAAGALALTGTLLGPPRAAAQVAGMQELAGDTLAVSLEDARRLALSRNPAYLAERQQTAIASGGLRQARVYNFNPRLEVEAPSAIDGTGVGRYEASLTQEIEWAGQRGTRIRAAQFGVQAAEAEVRDATRMVVEEASVSFYAALAAERRLQVTGELMELNRRLLEATRIQLDEGEISAMEANLAEIEVGRARARVLTAEREYTDRRLELQRVLGIPPDVFVVPEAENAPMPVPDPASLRVDSLVAVALDRRPDLQARLREVDRLGALTSLTRRQAIPNLEIGALREREAPNAEARFGIGVSVPVPLWNRNQGLVAERLAQTEQAQLQRQATELAIRTEVAAAVRAYQTAAEEARIYSADVVEPARRNQQLLDIAYREGKIGLAELLLLRNQLLDAEFGYWDAWLAERRSLTRLQAATGELGSAYDTSQNPGGIR